MTDQKGNQDFHGADFADAGDWKDIKTAAASVQKMYESTIKKAEETLAWYYQKRRFPRRMAQLLRVFAFIFACAGSLVPLINYKPPEPWENLGYILLAIAGLILLANSTLGFASAWIRYLRTAMSITEALDTFRFEYAAICLEQKGLEDTYEHIANQLNRIKAFMETINNLVKKETDEWAVAFKNDLARLESMLQSRTGKDGTKG